MKQTAMSLTRTLLTLCLFGLLAGPASAHVSGPDFDGDHYVGFSDFILFAGAFGSTQERFDLTGDGRVDFQDFVAFARDFGKVVREEGGATIVVTPSTFENLQRYIFNKNCISSSCHVTSTAAGGLSLEPDVAYENLVDRAPQNPTALENRMKRVVPGAPDQSFLIKKLTGSGVGYGDPMPRGASLSGVQIDAVRTWIAAGAPRQGVVEGMPDLSALAIKRVFEPPEPPERGIQIHLEPFAVEPGKEREIFSATRLGATEDLMVNKIEIVQPEGSHHFIIYKVDDEEARKLPPGLRDFNPTNPLQALGIFSRRFIVGTQTPYTLLEFPEGVVIPMPANAVYEFNSHFVNTSGVNTLVGEVYINLHTIPADEVKHVTKPIFVAHLGLAIPPGQTVTSGRSWTLDRDINLLLLSSHMHRHGRQFDIFLGENRIYQSFDWADPKTLLFDPPLQVKAGEKVRFECTHENDDKPFTIRFGFTAENDEMCIILGYYY